MEACRLLCLCDNESAFKGSFSDRNSSQRRRNTLCGCSLLETSTSTEGTMPESCLGTVTVELSSKIEVSHVPNSYTRQNVYETVEPHGHEAHRPARKFFLSHLISLAGHLKFASYSSYVWQFWAVVLDYYIPFTYAGRQQEIKRLSQRSLKHSLFWRWVQKSRSVLTYIHPVSRFHKTIIEHGSQLPTAPRNK